MLLENIPLGADAQATTPSVSAEFADLVLDAAPGARILTTTRESLGSDGEVVFPLLSLNEYASELFVTRASAVDPNLEISADDPRVLEIEVEHRRLALVAVIEIREDRLDAVGRNNPLLAI